jgi:hypothetical protein
MKNEHTNFLSNFWQIMACRGLPNSLLRGVFNHGFPPVLFGRAKAILDGYASSLSIVERC